MGAPDISDLVMLLYKLNKLQEQLNAIEARQRANDQHDSTCSMLQVEKAQRHTSMYLTPKPCDCWLSADTPPT